MSVSWLKLLASINFYPSASSPVLVPSVCTYCCLSKEALLVALTSWESSVHMEGDVSGVPELSWLPAETEQRTSSSQPHSSRSLKLNYLCPGEKGTCPGDHNGQCPALVKASSLSSFMVVSLHQDVLSPLPGITISLSPSHPKVALRETSDTACEGECGLQLRCLPP